MRVLHLNFDDDDFESLEQFKVERGWTWRELVLSVLGADVFKQALDKAIQQSHLLCRPEIDDIGTCGNNRELWLMCACGDYEVLMKENGKGGRVE